MRTPKSCPTHTIHVWYIYLHLVNFYGISVGTYTVRPMDAMDRHHVDLPAAKNLP